MSKDCLVLGMDYQPLTIVPLSVISWDKAIVKVFKGNARVVEEYEDWTLRSQNQTINVPAVIALTRKQKVRHKVRLSRFNILLDNFTCQFCGDKYHIFDNKNLTKDHVLAKSKGGPGTWNNLVAACSDCNLKKGDKDNIRPKKMPYKPDYWELASKIKDHPIKIKHPSWIPYLGRTEDNTTRRQYRKLSSTKNQKAKIIAPLIFTCKRGYCIKDNMKVLHSADWHILLNKKKVPYDWQINRFYMFFEKLHKLEEDCDIHIISGDVFDRSPTPDEICLFLCFLNGVKKPTFIIDGNHEATAKGKTFFSYFLDHNAINNPLVHIITTNQRIEFQGQGFQFFPYCEMVKDNLPSCNPNDILVTHIRGEVPPHITAEYDFNKLSGWKLILLGDLHFHHQYPKNKAAWYPGSPLNVSFDRDNKRQYGIQIIDFNSISDYKVNFIDLELPKLIRKTVTAGEELTPDSYHHIIYEVTGSLDELAKVNKSELLDKKLVENRNSSVQLRLKNKTIPEELEEYLKFIGVKDIEPIMKQFHEVYKV